MKKANYKYYLANGETIEYSLSPDVKLVNLVNDIVCSYASAVSNLSIIPNIVWVVPEIAAALNRECALLSSFHIGQIDHMGPAILRLNTIVGPVEILAEHNLEFPIFFGSVKEYEDNCFNIPMEKILNE